VITIDFEGFRRKRYRLTVIIAARLAEIKKNYERAE
jgi:hypothetical protein